MTIRHILFPVDFSDHCRAVAPAVAALARRAGASVSLLHALELPAGGQGDWQAFLNLVDVDAFRQDAASHLERFLAESLEGIEVRRVLVEGRAPEAIVEYADAQGTGLIMMPSRGLSRFRALLMGSVTERVLHDARCPVWTEAHAASQQAPPERYRSVVCALDLSPESVSVSRWAAGFASLWNASLHAVHVAPDGGAVHADEAFRRMVVTTTVCDPEVTTGDLVDVLLDRVRRHEADLLVTGRGHLAARLGSFRTHSLELVRRSHCPVVCV